MDKKTLNIFKIGGNVIDDSIRLKEFLMNFAAIEGAKILVHGGGKTATEMSAKLGIKSIFHNGRRITTQEELDVVAMVYAGLISKNMVAQLQANSCNAIGLCGADANCIEAVKRPAKPFDFGFAGDIVKVNDQQVQVFLNMGLSPVFNAIGHNNNGQLLNTNADTIAAELAKALSNQYHVNLNYCFEKNGVLSNVEDDNSAIPILDQKSYTTMIQEQSIHSGMLPKLENCFYALNHGVDNVRIGSDKHLSTGSDIHTKIVL